MVLMNEQPSRSRTAVSPVEIRVAAELGQLSILRALVETIALMEDFTLDEVSDIRLAVDEVASILILGASPGTVLSCEFTIGTNTLQVRASAVWKQPGQPEAQGFGWHVLRTLTDSVEATQHPYDAASAGYPTVIAFGRARGVVDGG